MLQCPGSALRQARVLASQVIVPGEVDPTRWYDVRQGRRREDSRPGMVLLDLGARLLPFPAACLEFRGANEETVPSVPARIVSPIRLTRRATIAIAASILPLGVAAIYAASRMGIRAG